MASTVLLKHGKTDGIAVYVPKETILKEMAAGNFPIHLVYVAVSSSEAVQKRVTCVKVTAKRLAQKQMRNSYKLTALSV
jgi:hypothetical protein